MNVSEKFTSPKSIPVTEAITGGETLTDLGQPEQALAQFYRAFNSRDIELMKQNWESSDEIAMDNPLGGIRRGWENIGPVYERIFGGKSKVYVEFHDYTLHVSKDLFYAVGRERGWFESGDKRLELAIRTTRIFGRRGNGWRQLHHHGSIDDATLLASYQEAVK